MKTISCEVVRFDDGSVDEKSTTANFAGQLAELVAQETADFDTVAVEIDSFLKANPNLRTIPTSALVRSLWEQRLESGSLKGVSPTDRDAQYKRLEAVVPEYVKAQSDSFHMGRKSGIAILSRLDEESRAKLANAKAAA